MARKALTVMATVGGLGFSAIMIYELCNVGLCAWQDRGFKLP